MSTQKKPVARWEVGGPEAAALLRLARNAPSSQPADARAAEARFLNTFREQDQQRLEGRGRVVAHARWKYAVAAGLALALAAGVFGLGMRFRSEPLSYRVKSGEVASRFIQADREPVELAFSDGTLVTVNAGTKARVAETTQRGARFLLESGRMDFDVVPHPGGGKWLVEAGAFQVHVTGTVFSVSWNEADGLLQVEVTRGHVVVEGAGQRRELGPGDSFHHREPPAQSVDPLASPPNIAPAEAAAAGLRAGGDASQPDSQPKPAGVGSSGRGKEPSWAELVGSGRFDRVIDAATQRGMQSCLDGCSRADLRALADAARLGGRLSLAQQALSAQRARFAGSVDAVAAAFLLGRLAEDRGEAGATAWYDVYLAEAPSGRFAGDALGRKMMIIAKLDQRRALPLAREYQLKFPAGPYAAHAKSLLAAAGAD